MRIREDFLPLSRPSISEKEIQEVERCLRSGWITTGPLCKAFEEKFCEITGAPHAISVSSGTAGMHLMMLALGIKRGDEVITPSMTFASTLNMITLCGAKPVFVDIDYPTLNINADLIEEKVTPRTRAIIPVHFSGCPADMDKILNLAQRCQLNVIEDAAHAVGAYYKGIHVGGWGQSAIFSFHPIKNITTGEGGMITHSNDAFENRLRLLRFHGIERDAWKRYGKGGNPGYDIETPGFKYNLTDLQAALGLAQVSRLDELNSRRRHLADLYRKGLESVDGLDLPGVPGYLHIHSWHLFVIKIISMERERFMQKLSEYNIGYGIHFPAGHHLSYIKRRHRVKKSDLKETERVSDKLISLPLFPGMMEEDVSYVCEAIREILGHE
ncbi:MAG TPA: aminotransferase class I/II-fold pyridoxal phosphate-dependent enzyme [Thermodesulfobacteriota bacterium]|nr:aminotransferase class I/II-fold pyridoxal phosphate-dependent enzyme [Thermodesulfobacteriota bacterium]